MDSAAPPPPCSTSPKEGAEITCTVPPTPSPRSRCFAKGNHPASSPPAIASPPPPPRSPPTSRPPSCCSSPPPKRAPHALPWRVFVIEDTPKNFPDGGAFVANFHNKDIRFVIGEQQDHAPPRAPPMASPGRTKRDDFNMAPVVFEFRKRTNGAPPARACCGSCPACAI